MQKNAKEQLVQAKALFYSWRLVEAYGLFRRYFDRIPFLVEKEHAEYIGMFLRVLLELGKENELVFYESELEKHYHLRNEPAVAYSLASIYIYREDNREKLDAAKRIFESLSQSPEAPGFHAKAKIMLVSLYFYHDDITACRMILDSIQTDDPALRPLVVIWRAIILRRENKANESIALLDQILLSIRPQDDWYAHLSANIALAKAYLEIGKTKKSQEIVGAIRKLFDGRNFRTVREQIKQLDKLIFEKTGVGSLTVLYNRHGCVITHTARTLHLQEDSISDRLLLHLIEKRSSDKARIVSFLYGREYEGKEDDKLIYYHVHSARKKLKTIGLPEDSIVHERDSYRLVLQTQVSRRNHETHRENRMA